MREPGHHHGVADSSGVGSPHPALRATFSHGEKGFPVALGVLAYGALSTR